MGILCPAPQPSNCVGQALGAPRAVVLNGEDRLLGSQKAPRLHGSVGDAPQLDHRRQRRLRVISGGEPYEVLHFLLGTPICVLEGLGNGLGINHAREGRQVHQLLEPILHPYSCP